MRRGIAFAMLALGLLAPAAHAQGEGDRYALVHGCYALKAGESYVAKTGAGYRATAAGVGEAEPFRMQATALGRYLFYGKARDFMAAGSGALPLPGTPTAVEPAAKASESADWRVDEAGGNRFRIVLPSEDKALAVAGGGELVLEGGQGDTFAFEKADGCPAFPESEVNATGEVAGGSTPYTEVRGFIDAHLHMMAFEFLGGRAHCARPWHPYGIEYAMVDCPDHGPDGRGAVLENVLYKDPAHGHDTVGWPTFRDWPHHLSLTHEQTYWKWMERAWRGGLRVFVNLFVDNAVLCELYPYKQNSCNEMDGVRLQARRIREVENYIDAQFGGPGKGFFRIVTDPYEARRVINDGKLAVVLGIETSKLFDCGLNNDQAECDTEQIDRQLDEVYKLGVRDMELVNKFDNALAGVAGDAGSTGTVTNTGNKYETGQFWQLDTCMGPADQADKEQLTPHNEDNLVANGIATFLPPGAAPIYPEPPHCNRRGLSSLGEHLIRRMIEKKMIIDPDHLSVLARKHVMSLIEAADYSGVVSSHSWSTYDAYPRIYSAGGVITPYAGDSTSFVEEWKKVKPMFKSSQYFGFGYGADMNGFGSQGGPRVGAKNPVQYPFKSFDGKVTLDRQRAGQRVWDINTDGVAHYGLYPDWIEDLRKLAGDQIVEDMARGPEAYLQMWERTLGVPKMDCRSARGKFTRKGLFRVLLGDTPRRLLERAGQPQSRKHRTWKWCVQGNRNRGRHVSAAFTPQGTVGLVATNALGHRALRIQRGSRATRLGRRARRFGKGIRVRRAGRGVSYVFGVRRGRVRYIAVASRTAMKSRGRLRAYLRTAGIR